MPLRLLGPIHDTPYFEQEVRPRLGDGIDYLGHRSIADVAEIVRHAAVAVVTPTWEEPFGLVVAEALSCGTPVAGFARGALPELIDGRTGILAAPDDVPGLAHAMLEAATLRRADCRARAEANYGAVAMVDAYESWFDGLIASRG
jgi:glycosyltransferase involved in cell wall biosynthesis